MYLWWLGNLRSLLKDCLSYAALSHVTLSHWYVTVAQCYMTIQQCFATFSYCIFFRFATLCYFILVVCCFRTMLCCMYYVAILLVGKRSQLDSESEDGSLENAEKMYRLSEDDFDSRKLVSCQATLIFRLLVFPFSVDIICKKLIVSTETELTPKLFLCLQSLHKRISAHMLILAS